MDEVRRGGVYRNLKTLQLYRVTGFAHHSETQELLVLYGLAGLSEPTVWARPLALFREKFAERRTCNQHADCSLKPKGDLCVFDEEDGGDAFGR